MNNVIQALHKVGIKVLMDDFGTGYSSMMMLKNVAIDVRSWTKALSTILGMTAVKKSFQISFIWLILCK